MNTLKIFHLSILQFRELFVFCLLLILLIGVNGCTSQGTPEEWPGITVKVNSDYPLETSKTLTNAKGSFQRLDITISNPGTNIVTIEHIEIHVPLPESLSGEMKVAYGSSCMGTRPVLIHPVNEPQEMSESYMYAMVRMDVEQYLFAGSLSWRIFLPTIRLEDQAFVIRSKGEDKQLKPGERIHYEQIVLSLSSDWQDLLGNFGAAIAEENGIEKVKDIEYSGWATWDYYAYGFSEEDIYENTELIRQIDSSSNLIQIDAGWYSQRGDFATSRPDLTGGMKAVADRIKAAGMIPGIWLDGFRANTDSEVFKKHPEYFLHDHDGNPIVQVRKPEGVPDRDRVYLDYSHPGARAHMTACIRFIREEMGIPYFKVDFMRYGLNNEILNANPGYRSIKAHDPSITDVERMRLGLKTIREAIGPNNYLLGCSAVFGPCIGFVDGMRTGGDINPRFEDFPERVLANMGNSYLSGKVFNGDADYLVFRAAEDEDASVAPGSSKHGGNLTLNEAQMWADFSKLYGNCRLSSDKLLTLRPERQVLLRDVLGFPAMDETVPVDFWRHGKDSGDAFELLLAKHGKAIYVGIFNWSDESREYKLTAFEEGPQVLDPRHSRVLKYKGSLSFSELCKKLSAELEKDQ